MLARASGPLNWDGQAPGGATPKRATNASTPRSSASSKASDVAMMERFCLDSTSGGFVMGVPLHAEFVDLAAAQRAQPSVPVMAKRCSSA
jgi:hypothetical protein